MKFSRLIFGVFAAHFVGATFVFASASANPMQPEPRNLKWKKTVIEIAVSSSLTEPSTSIKTNSDVLGALSRGLSAWSDAAGLEFRLVTSDGQNVSQQGQKGDGVSLITIAPSADNLLLFARDPFSEAARTRIFYSKRGLITEADIVLNPYQQFSTDGTYGTFDLEKTFAHEIGHLLGLTHSAVIGALMSAKVERNKPDTKLEPVVPLLSETDVAAVRSLYGGNDDDECCGAITGRLLLSSGKAARQTVVWAEDSETGSVVAQVGTESDGSYRIGGLNSGSYSVFWQHKDKRSEIALGDLGKATVARNNVTLTTKRIGGDRSGVSLGFIGIGFQIGESAVSLKPGGQYSIFLGGRKLDEKSVAIEFNSPFLQLDAGSVRAEDFGDDIEVISFVIRVDPEIEPGSYSIFARDLDGNRVGLIGAISVGNTLK